MNYKRAILFVGTACLASQGFANILVNPGFETGDMTGWTTTNFTATNNDSHTGSWSTIDFGNFSVEQDFAPVMGSDITEISVWAKQPDLTSFFFAFDIIYSDSTFNTSLGSGSPSNVWTKLDFTSAVDTSKMVTGIRAWGYSSSNGTNDVTWYDDFVVNTNSVPEPASMAALGFGALALLRRRKK
ncbi:MAG: PEP-CTERM sorting domain-containing protein [Armatimonadetes bacterium]|nr:PEP-CTERM sorting domain-containing protein [Armatimonadota bacterium]MBS1725178.1 PEP-CTERM sorting domain-containing protein [Armatimonadota bacterium]